MSSRNSSCVCECVPVAQPTVQGYKNLNRIALLSRASTLAETLFLKSPRRSGYSRRISYALVPSRLSTKGKLIETRLFRNAVYLYHQKLEIQGCCDDHLQEMQEKLQACSQKNVAYSLIVGALVTWAIYTQGQLLL